MRGNDVHLASGRHFHTKFYREKLTCDTLCLPFHGTCQNLNN